MNDIDLIDFYSQTENHFKSLAGSYDRMAILSLERGLIDSFYTYKQKARKYLNMAIYAHGCFVTAVELSGVNWMDIFKEIEGAE